MKTICTTSHDCTPNLLVVFIFSVVVILLVVVCVLSVFLYKVYRRGAGGNGGMHVFYNGGTVDGERLVSTCCNYVVCFHYCCI